MLAGSCTFEIVSAFPRTSTAGGTRPGEGGGGVNEGVPLLDGAPGTARVDAEGFASEPNEGSGVTNGEGAESPGAGWRIEREPIAMPPGIGSARAERDLRFKVDVEGALKAGS